MALNSVFQLSSGLFDSFHLKGMTAKTAQIVPGRPERPEHFLVYPFYALGLKMSLYVEWMLTDQIVRQSRSQNSQSARNSGGAASMHTKHHKESSGIFR